MKSPPELWAEVSDEDALGRHLSGFGEVRIIRMEPETTVAWEGDRVRGTVALEPSGWGTKVTLEAEVVVEETPVAEPEPAPVVSPAPEEPKRGFFARLLGRRSKVVAVETAAVAPPPPPPVVVPEPVDEGILVAVLDDLGAAHHRPFSRS